MPKINQHITASEVMLITDSGPAGVMSLHAALTIAEDAGMDLVEIAPQSKPPVCKIMNFGKFRYEAKKKLQKAKKNQKVILIKEIRLRPNIGAHDLNVKLNQIKGFIADGEKVKLSMRFKGREVTHQDIGLNIINKLLADISETTKPESPLKVERNQITVMLVQK